MIQGGVAMEFIFSIVLMLLFFRILGFVIRMGFKLLGFLLGLMGTLIVFTLPVVLIGVFWNVLPILFAVGLIATLARPRIA